MRILARNMLIGLAGCLMPLLACGENGKQSSGQSRTVSVRYQDGGTGTVFGKARFALPIDADRMIRLHKDFRDRYAIAQSLKPSSRYWSPNKPNWKPSRNGWPPWNINRNRFCAARATANTSVW